VLTVNQTDRKATKPKVTGSNPVGRAEEGLRVLELTTGSRTPTDPGCVPPSGRAISEAISEKTEQRLEDRGIEHRVKERASRIS